MTDDADDSGLECVGISIATQAHLIALGFVWHWPFALCVVRCDGVRQQMACETLDGVAELVAELNPPALGLSVGPHEDHDELLAAIRGRDPGHITLH